MNVLTLSVAVLACGVDAGQPETDGGEPLPTCSWPAGRYDTTTTITSWDGVCNTMIPVRNTLEFTSDGAMVPPIPFTVCETVKHLDTCEITVICRSDVWWHGKARLDGKIDRNGGSGKLVLTGQFPDCTMESYTFKMTKVP